MITILVGTYENAGLWAVLRDEKFVVRVVSLEQMYERLYV